MQQLMTALLFILIAGVINGSFALPTKYITKWKFENIWLQFALWAFVILPWVIIYIFVPQLFQVYAATPTSLLWIIFVGGVLFGVGQLCFALALNMIGLGLGFVINLGVGISLGFMLPLLFQHAEKIFTPFGGITLLGVTCAIIGLIISNYAGLLRDRDRHELRQKEVTHDTMSTEIDTQGVGSKHAVGVALAIVAGVFSAGQNFTFSLTYQVQEIAQQLSSSSSGIGVASVIWPLFLTCGFIPYALYTLYLHRKNKSFSNYRVAGTAKYHLFAIVMGLFWYGSLMFYSKASQMIGKIGPLVGWPIFMVLIIMVSSFWGWKHREWEHCGAKAKRVMRYGLLFLVIAIIILAYGAGQG